MRRETLPKMLKDLMRNEVMPALVSIDHDDPLASAIYSNMKDAVENRVGVWLKQQPNGSDVASQLNKHLPPLQSSENLFLYLLNLSVKVYTGDEPHKRETLSNKVIKIAAITEDTLNRPLQAQFLIDELMDKSRGASR
jgi:hypothetical protein